jgi:archaellum biogenesis protein FlaJ (TadC family)
MKFVIILAFFAILASLGSALFFMMQGRRRRKLEADDAERSRKMFRALALRVALSVALFLCVLMAAKLGWIQPTAGSLAIAGCAAPLAIKTKAPCAFHSLISVLFDAEINAGLA